jgi:hypothetical protein
MPQTSPNLLGARRVGNLLLSVMDNIIVPGSGYTGNGDSNVGGGNTATTSVMYATDIPMVFLDDPVIFPSSLANMVDRNLNTVRARAQRYGAVVWDNFRHGAVRVLLGV